MNNNEMNVTDILKELRELADTAPDGIIAIKGHVIADRLDAALKREYDFPRSQSVDADKRTGKDINGVIDDLLKSSKYYYHRGDLVQGQFCLVTAYRIREAWKREAKAIATENAVLPAVCITKSSGNAAKMREAVVLALSLLDLKDGVPYKTISQKDIDFMKSALSDPPRNCDVGTADEQAQRYDKFCEGTECVKCPVHALWHHYFEICKNGRVSCGLMWAQMPYEAEGGAGK